MSKESPLIPSRCGVYCALASPPCVTVLKLGSPLRKLFTILEHSAVIELLLMTFIQEQSRKSVVSQEVETAYIVCFSPLIIITYY